MVVNVVSTITTLSTTLATFFVIGSGRGGSSRRLVRCLSDSVRWLLDGSWGPGTSHSFFKQSIFVGLRFVFIIVL